MGAIVDAVLNQSVRNGWAEPWTMHRTLVAAAPGALSERDTPPGHRPGRRRPARQPALSHALAGAHRTHPEYFQQVAAADGLRPGDPTPGSSTTSRSWPETAGPSPRRSPPPSTTSAARRRSCWPAPNWWAPTSRSSSVA